MLLLPHASVAEAAQQTFVKISRLRQGSAKATTMRTTTSTAPPTALFAEGAASPLVVSSVGHKVISVPPEDQLSPAIDETTGPLAAELLEFCEMDLFPETLQNSEFTSSSNCYQENFSYPANLSFPSDVNTNCSSEPIESNKFRNHLNENSTRYRTFDAATSAAIIDNNSALSIIFDSQDELGNTISSSIDFSTSPPYSGAPYLTIAHQDQLDFSSIDPEGQLTDIAVNSLSISQYPSDHVISFMSPTLSSAYEEDCLPIMPPFLRLNPSACSSYTLVDPSIDSPGTLNSTLAADNSGLFTKTILVGSELQSKEPEYFGDPSGKFCADQLECVYKSSQIQCLHNDKQLVNGAVSTPMSTEISTLEDPTIKPGKLSAEKRREKIHKYLKKRNERNFNKKIKYACRKTLADSRPRVRGRFAKNDEFGDTQMHAGSQHEEYDYDEALVPVKVEDHMVNSSEIFSHVSGVNSFKCGFLI
ncbi:hypothetical protein V2J09_017861 [Rumex salicifolius]